MATGLFLVFMVPNLASTLGISNDAARKAIDIIASAGTLFAIIGLIGAITGAGAIGAEVLFTAKALVRKYGRKYAAAW